jgi:hypothetical protein
MAGKAQAPVKPVAPGWGDDDKKKDEPVEPLTDREITGLRAILDRHGFDRDKGSF